MKFAVWLYTHSKITLVLAVLCGVAIVYGFYFEHHFTALFVFAPMAVFTVLGGARPLSAFFWKH